MRRSDRIIPQECRELLLDVDEDSKLGSMTGTTCDVTVPPDMCALSGGYVRESAWRADGSGARAIVIFVPQALKHISATRRRFVDYKDDVIESLYNCIPGSITPDTSFPNVINCIVSQIIEWYKTPPTVLIVSQIDLTGYNLGPGAVMTVTVHEMNVKAYVLPHLSLVNSV